MHPSVPCEQIQRCQKPCPRLGQQFGAHEMRRRGRNSLLIHLQVSQHRQVPCYLTNLISSRCSNLFIPSRPHEGEDLVELLLQLRPGGSRLQLRLATELLEPRRLWLSRTASVAEPAGTMTICGCSWDSWDLEKPGAGIRRD